jgi:hypothetical protein
LPGAGVLVLIAVLAAPGLLRAADPGDPFKPRRFRVESVPGGAEVFVIGGRIGTTPLTLSERDIYPNWYPDDQAHLYGTIVLRMAGCREYARRVGLDDIEAGIEARLDCGQDTVAEAQPPPPGPAPAAAPVADSPTTAAAAVTLQRRLRQLKVLQELMEDGLVTEQEERTIRKRILDAP